ncbi:hypothetical protein [Marinobacter sp.]|uniref:hypothetical protein n=1 Tax=Marinobacter sp. TaxID=50741 RepID=UPI0032973D04
MMSPTATFALALLPLPHLLRLGERALPIRFLRHLALRRALRHRDLRHLVQRAGGLRVVVLHVVVLHRAEVARLHRP